MKCFAAKDGSLGVPEGEQGRVVRGRIFSSSRVVADAGTGEVGLLVDHREFYLRIYYTPWRGQLPTGRWCLGVKIRVLRWK